MTKVRVIKTGEVMYLIGVMPRIGVKGGCGGKAVAICAADPHKHGGAGQRYAIVHYQMKALELVEDLNWERTGDQDENNALISPVGEVNIPTVEERRTKAMTMMKKEQKRFEASKEFAAKKVCSRMVKGTSKKTEGNAPKKTI